MDYNSLILQLQSWANRNEQAFIDALPDIITQAMGKINREAKTIGYQKTVEGNTTINVPFILKPPDYKQSVSLLITDPDTGISEFLLIRNYEFCVAYSPSINTSKPVFYSDDLDIPEQRIAPSYLYLSPIPDKAYAYQLKYLGFPPSFDVANPRNFLTDKYQDLLLYACLVIAIPYLKSDERIPTFRALYQEALESVNSTTQGRYTDRITQRDKD